jgi:alkanesulfonate monooxygenase SsuD/methylene tetrahydromethanopterin reductase-like flavin-dependent oxidoreductase (luciferase family)
MPDPGMAGVAFGSGSVSLGLSAVGRSGTEIVEGFAADAVAAEHAGFDGVTLSEHHAGFPGYVATPILLTSVLLARTRAIWAAPGPGILPLRNATTVAEDLAWLACAYPGRTGAAFVPGYQQRDFEAVSVGFDQRRTAFWNALDRVAVDLRGAGSLIADDPAVQQLRPAGVPLLAGVGGPVGARRAAQAGVGMLLMSLRPPDELAVLVGEYRAHGGAGPIVLIRRVSLHEGAVGLAQNLTTWQGASAGATWLSASDEAVVTGSPPEVAASLVAAARRAGATALNLRLGAYSEGAGEAARRQIVELGASVLPALRAALAELPSS